MASFTDIWFDLQQAGKPTPYLLVDCAGIEGGEARLPKHIFSELECLFTGDLAIELADVGPYLGRLQSFEPEVASAVEDLLSRHVGILVVLEDSPPEQAGITFSQLHRHFRKFNVVYGPDGKPLFFRYYDPRAVVDVLKALAAMQLEVFYGPVSTFILFGRNEQAVRCRVDSGSLTVLE
jgi:hypothetical protein